MDVNKYYIESGWHIKRVWEHEIKQDSIYTVEEILQFIEEEKTEQFTRIPHYHLTDYL